MSARRITLSFDLVDQESDWTIRLRKSKMDQLGVVMKFDGHADRWTVNRYRRVPYLREIPRSERRQLLAGRWQQWDSEQFEGFEDARATARQVVESLTGQGYEISGVASSSYDLPPW